MFIKNLYKPENRIANCNEDLLYPVLSATKLLTGTRGLLLDQLSALITAPDGYYEAFYLSLIERFARFVQILPISDIGPLGELLDEGLQRATIALQVQKEKPLNTPEPLLLFAIFSGILLADIDKVCQFKKIVVSDENGHAIKEWLPFENVFMNEGSYYRIRPYRIVYPPDIKLLLAQMLMPAEAFLWLIQDHKIFRLWLAILLGQEEDESTRGVKNILSLIKERMDLLHEQTPQQPLGPIKIDAVQPEQTALGEEFLQWLKTGLNDQSISINQENSHVHILKEGALLTHPEIFKEFAKVKNYRDWVVVQQQFNYLGLTKLSGFDKKFEQFFSEGPTSVAKRLGSLRNETATSVKAKKMGVLLDSEWLYTSFNTPMPITSNQVALQRQNVLSNKRMWPQLAKNAMGYQPKMIK